MERSVPDMFIKSVWASSSQDTRRCMAQRRSQLIGATEEHTAIQGEKLPVPSPRITRISSATSTSSEPISLPRRYITPEEKRLTLSDARDGISILIGNLDGELLLDGHDDLYGVERVEAEVFGEG
jgi:hypothetical protein